jgi:hypothetical protein
MHPIKQDGCQKKEIYKSLKFQEIMPDDAGISVFRAV